MKKARWYYLNKSPRSRKKRILKKWAKLQEQAKISFNEFLKKLPGAVSQVLERELPKLERELFKEDFCLKDSPVFEIPGGSMNFPFSPENKRA